MSTEIPGSSRVTNIKHPAKFNLDKNTGLEERSKYLENDPRIYEVFEGLHLYISSPERAAS